jgi:hypothetical protein
LCSTYTIEYYGLVKIYKYIWNNNTGEFHNITLLERKSIQQQVYLNCGAERAGWYLSLGHRGWRQVKDQPSEMWAMWSYSFAKIH